MLMWADADAASGDESDRQVQAFYLMELPDVDAALAWANKLPTYGYVEVRELLQY